MYPEYDPEESDDLYIPGKGAYEALWVYAATHPWRIGRDLIAIYWDRCLYAEKFSFLKDLVDLLGLDFSLEAPSLDVLAAITFGEFPPGVKVYVVIGFNDATQMFNAELARMRMRRIFQQYEASQGREILFPEDEEEDDEGEWM